jgi:uncharacterized protein (TIGR00369 family)
VRDKDEECTTNEACEVSEAQKISRMCFVCGQQNSMGLHAQFLNLKDGRLYTRFKTLEEHQSYPGRVHGGVISAVLDEAIGRVIQVNNPDTFGVTIELNVKFRKPVPLGVELTVVAWETKHSHRLLAGEGELLLEDGSVAASASGRYLRMSVDAITDGGLMDSDWLDDLRGYPQEVLV